MLLAAVMHIVATRHVALLERLLQLSTAFAILPATMHLVLGILF